MSRMGTNEFSNGRGVGLGKEDTDFGLRGHRQDGCVTLGAREIPPTLGWRGPSRGGRDLCEEGAGG